jgi:alginate O-acetyltransferase complex protein AlgJ
MNSQIEFSLKIGRDGLLSLAFCILLFLPLLDVVLSLDPAPQLNELRPLADWPTFSWQPKVLMSLPKKLETYFDDHFGFRRSLIRLHNRARLVLLGNPLDTDVVYGKEDWLFLNTGGGLVDDHRALEELDRDYLMAFADALRERRDLLSLVGIQYLYVVAPDKSTIYPEFLPERVKRARPDDRYDQLFDFLTTETSLPIVDLREPLRASKSRGLLYHRTDTHWNDLGAWVAYREIQKKVSTWFPSAAPFPLEDFRIQERNKRGLGLSRMLGLQDLQRERELLEIRPRRSRQRLAVLIERQESARPGEKGFIFRSRGRREPFAMEVANTALPRAVMFRDSFTTALVPYLSEHYERIVYYWQPRMDLRAILYEMPDIVIEERVERLATTSLPAPLLGVSEFRRLASRPEEEPPVTKALLAAGDSRASSKEAGR